MHASSLECKFLEKRICKTMHACWKRICKTMQYLRFTANRKNQTEKLCTSVATIARNSLTTRIYKTMHVFWKRIRICKTMHAELRQAKIEAENVCILSVLSARNFSRNVSARRYMFSGSNKAYLRDDACFIHVICEQRNTVWNVMCEHRQNKCRMR